MTINCDCGHVVLNGRTYYVQDNYTPHMGQCYSLGLNDLDIEDMSEIRGLERLANLTRLHLERNKLTKISGLERLKNLQFLHLNENDTPARKRFTLFHEAFHILAHSRAEPIFKKRHSSAGSFNELLAEYFAGCILMPREWVKAKWEEVNDLSEMAEIFRVTEQQMWLRLKVLRLADDLPLPEASDCLTQ